MNKFFTKIAGLTLGLAMAIGVGVAVGGNNTKQVNATATETTSGDVTTWTFNAKADIGTSTTWKYTKGAPGNYESDRGISWYQTAFTLEYTATFNISNVTIDASANGSGSIKVNNGTAKTLSSGDRHASLSYNVTVSSGSKITIDSAAGGKTIWIKSISVTASGGGGGGAPSETISSGTTTYVFNSKSWGATVGSTAKNWTSGKDGNQYNTTNKGVQITTGTTGANATSPATFNNVKTVTVTYCTNASSGAGTIKIQVGTNTEQSFTITTSGGTTLRDATFTYTPTRQNGVIKLTATCSTNSFYINSVTVTCEAADSISSLTVTNPKVSFTVGQPFTHVKDNTTVVTATYATAGAKTVTSGFTYTLGGVAVTTSYTMAKADNGKTVIVTYTDSDGLSKAADGYAISVDYEALDSDHLTMTTGPVNVSLSDGTVQLSASVTNSNADPTITWSSDDTDKATVNSSGLVTLKAAGSVVITASGANSVSKTCTVVISATPSVTLDVTSISDKYTGDPDVTITPDAKNVPNDAVYIWASTNENVATVTKGEGNVGVVHFEGTSTQTERIELTIKNAAETATLCSAFATLSNITKSEVLDLSLSESAHTLYDGKFVNSFTLTATIDDEDVVGNANKNITWTSSDPTIADVDNGEVVVLGEGGDNENPVTVTITAASTYSPSVSRTCTVTVLHDTVNKITWNGKNTPASFYTGDVLEDVSNWTFDAEWASGGKENDLSWGTGSNVVHLNKCAVGVNPTTETDDPLDTDYEVVIGDNNKRLVPFYGEFAATAKTMNVNQSAVSDIEISLDDRIVDNKLDMYDTEELTLDYTVTYVGNVDDGVDVDVSDDENLIALDNGTDGHGNGTITISGDPCNSVTLTLTSKEDSSVEETITIHIIEDEVQSLSWTGSGVADVLEYESSTKTLGQTLDSSNWSFTATWNAKVESNLTVGSGADNVNLGIFSTAEPSAYSEGTAYNASAKLDINLNGKYLVAFYKGVRASETIKLEIVDVLEKISTLTPREVTEEYFQKVTDISQIDSTTPFLIVGYNSYSSSYYAFNGNLTSLDGTGNLVVIGGTSSIVSGRIEATTALKNATFTYDSTTKGLKSNSGYYIGQTSNNNGMLSSTTVVYSNTVACSTTGTTTTTTITSSGGPKLQLMAQGGTSHASNSQFRYYKSSQTAIEIYKYVSVSETVYDETVYSNQDIDVQKQVVNFARYLNETMAVEGVCGSNEGNYGKHTTSALLTAWQNVSAKYTETVGSLTGEDLTLARNMLKYASAHWDGTPDVLQRAMATYDFVVSHYSSELVDAGMLTPNFINDGTSPLRSVSTQSNIILIAKNTSAVIVIVAISAISAAAIGGYFLFRKKKED